MYKIRLNGELKSLDETVSVSGLLSEMDLLEKRVAVEVNGEVVPKSLHGDTVLKTGDHVEIVTAIGGG